MTRQYAYYPGCSLSGTANEYDVATRAVLAALDVRLDEIKGWNCCGASAACAVSELMQYALPARTLALAERDLPGRDVLAPCSACYLNLRAAYEDCRADPRLHERTEQALKVESLGWDAVTEPRHLLDILANDIGAERIGQAVSRHLESMVIAPYYGCQALRPYAVFDDPERPTSMDPIIQATGADSLPWEMGARCCGASLSTTHPEAALSSIRGILLAAEEADAIVTVCPMCQLNLEAFQKQAGMSRTVTILYLPQLLGIAMGFGRNKLKIQANLSVSHDFLKRIRPAA